ncbi:nickel pincer cofactor biosynthesis protein LarB [Thermosulfurimonas marina]|uniref:Nickel pincer cofactor biosynthesis protein LarB n=1 Tax=Thermosulfurimonas marina TaxID=2047767 RepID=A0A6H1WSM8_9BACT|nr:nickel pincer cofactor biosynthesis protein LarB [Thermosulfurimonas marina]QJA06159.1 nickel pincer cofactor biosynthesis protein LarB [Thermosulfurimonas marina]
MTRERLRELLEKVQGKELSVEEALRELEGLPYEDLGSVRLDHHRALRKHFPEIVYAPGKTEGELRKIVHSFLARDLPLMITRLDPERAEGLLREFPGLRYHERARILTRERPPEGRGLVAVISAGTADLPVAEEARVAAEYFGNRVRTFYDVGVAGIHRLWAVREELLSARALIVVAGMEGALPGVVAGLVDRPVIAVPTSVGYGASFGGLAALLTMLNTCAPGVAVVNIDNGVGAAYFASIINHLVEEENGQKG